MSEPNCCPQCGAELPAGALGGLCPKCLLAAGLESRSDPPRPGGSGSEAPTTPHSRSFVPPEPAALTAHFPQLEIIELVGHGGMGAVYKARQKHLDRLVALKIVRPEPTHDPAFAERFNREARMLARLSHPSIVAVYDFGAVNPPNAAAGSEPRTLYYFLMEYVDGASLRQLMQAGELTPEQALAIVPQICEALQFAHDEGIVHRDIKPENILLDKRGRVKIADFGLAKLIAPSAEEFTLTGTHQVMGTPRYMAPEQMEGSHAVDHRADIYSLGVVFYEMLTGEVPAGHFEPPSKKVEIDVRLDEVVLRALAREPERRYQHASDVKTDVERCRSRHQGPIQAIDASSKTPGEDFLLMNPRLPVAARWITVYAIVVRPLLWLFVILLGFLSFESSLAGDYAEAAIVHAVDVFAGFFHLVFVVVVAIGGFKLRGLRRAGPRWIKIGLALGFAIGLLTLYGELFFAPRHLEELREVARTNPEQLIAEGFTQKEIDAILTDKEYPILVPHVINVFFAAVWLVLDIAVFVWLWRNSGYLPLADVKAMPEPQPAEAASAGAFSAAAPSLPRGETERRYEHASDVKTVVDPPSRTPRTIYVLGMSNLLLGILLLTALALVPALVAWGSRITDEATLQSAEQMAEAGDEVHSLFPVQHAIEKVIGAWLFQLVPVALIISGVGLLLCRVWGRLLALAYAAVQLSYSLIMFPLSQGRILATLGDQFRQGVSDEGPLFAPLMVAAALAPVLFIDVVYPVMLLIGLNRPRVRAAFHVNNIAAPPQGDSPPIEKLRSTLGRAWDDWWAERDRWFTGGVQAVLCLVFIVCLIMYLSFQSSSDRVLNADGQWLRHTTVTIGVPDPWFDWETYPDARTPFRWKIDWMSTSTGIMLLGFVAWCVNWQIEKAKAKLSGKKLRWWHGSPNFAIAFWGVATLVAAMMGIALAEVPQRLEQRAAEEKESPPSAPQAEPNGEQETAAGRGDVSGVKRLLDAGASVNDKDAEGKTALMTAAEGGHASLALLGANVNERDAQDRAANPQ